MSLQTPDDLTAELAEIDDLAAERGLDFTAAARAYWFGVRPGDGSRIDPAVLDMRTRRTRVVLRRLAA